MTVDFRSAQSELKLDPKDQIYFAHIMKYPASPIVISTQ